MNARELIVSNCMGEWNFVNAMIAAERVVERLQNRVDELMVSAHPIQTVQSERESYRDRLDRMVAACINGEKFTTTMGEYDKDKLASQRKYVSSAIKYLEAIDSAVDKEERK